MPEEKELSCTQAFSPYLEISLFKENQKYRGKNWSDGCYSARCGGAYLLDLDEEYLWDS